jgi:TRAP-type C4-dicarboxylate transport system permease small subunit
MKKTLPPDTSGPADLPVRLGARAAEIALGLMAVLIFADVVTRNLTSVNLYMTGELSGYLLVLVAFLGIPNGLRHGKLLRIELLIARLNTGARRALAVAYNLVALVLASILFWQFLQMVMTSHRRMILAPTLMQTPIWIPQSVLVLGAALLIWALVLETVDALRGRLHPLSEGEEGTGL